MADVLLSVVAVDEASRTMGDGGSRCCVTSPMPRSPYIWLGCFQVTHQGISSVVGDLAPLRRDLLLLPAWAEY
jgi:hypothetical protein